jgi:hypothetical protein
MAYSVFSQPISQLQQIGRHRSEAANFLLLATLRSPADDAGIDGLLVYVGDNSLYFQASGPDLIAGCKDTTQAAASILAQPAIPLLLPARIFILRL